MRQTENKLQYRQVTYTDGAAVYMFAILANLAAQFIVGIIGTVSGYATGKDIMSGGYFQLVCMIFFQLAFLAVPVIYCKAVKKFKPVFYAPLCKPKGETFISLALPVLTILGFFLPSQYFSLLLYKMGYNLSSGVDLSSAGKMALGIFALCIAAPFAEELVFRGFLLSGLRNRYNDYIAALMSAAAFTLMHMNPEQTVYQFFLGFTCALIALKSKNLFASVAVHSLSNLIAVIVGLKKVTALIERCFVYLNSHIAVAVTVTVVLAAAASAAVLLLCKLVGKLRGRRDEAQFQPVPENKSNATVMYWITFGLCCLMWISVFVSCMVTVA